LAWTPCILWISADAAKLIIPFCDAESKNRILITQNAQDFRGLFGRVDMHPGLIILPSTSRSATLQLFGAVLAFLGEQSNPRDYMFNRVLEVSLEGTIAADRI